MQQITLLQRRRWLPYYRRMHNPDNALRRFPQERFLLGFTYSCPHCCLYNQVMSDVSQILNAIEQGDAHAAEQLLPLVYEELRRLAAQKLAQERPGQTLQPTALVHEAYLRLVDTAKAQQWTSRGHFFAAAAEAMRRILVEKVRRKRSVKHGGELVRIDLEEALVVGDEPHEDLLELDELLEQLAGADARAAELVKLRFFAGLTGEQAASALGISPRTADSLWAYARAWLFEKWQRSRS